MLTQEQKDDLTMGILYIHTSIAKNKDVLCASDISYLVECTVKDAVDIYGEEAGEFVRNSDDYIKFKSFVETLPI